VLPGRVYFHPLYVGIVRHDLPGWLAFLRPGEPRDVGPADWFYRLLRQDVRGVLRLRVDSWHPAACTHRSDDGPELEVPRPAFARAGSGRGDRREVVVRHKQWSLSPCRHPSGAQPGGWPGRAGDSALARTSRAHSV